jgi:hypothetical protein
MLLALDENDKNFTLISNSVDSNPLRQINDLINYQEISNQINATYFNNIIEHIGNLSTFGSRVTGYPGYEQTINYIEEFFINNSLENVSTSSYPLLVPIDFGTTLSINNQTYSAHTLMPNSVHTCSTPSNGLSGTLIYGNSGKYTDLDGKKIEDSFVVLEFNTRSNWINSASLGAKGVIFLGPNSTDRFEAEEKTIDVPLNFPRIYIDNATTAQMLKTVAMQQNESITLHSAMKWESIEAKNIMGILPGVDDDIVIISAYFDSSSVVPSLSPGADEASGIATLLEIIRIIKDNDIIPQQTIMFLALSGHNQAAAGAREFVYQNYDLLNKPSGFKLFLSLDLSSTSNKIGINPYGY